MILGASNIWLLLLIFAYGMIALHWARFAGRERASGADFANAGGSLSSWMAAIAIVGVSLSGFFTLGVGPVIANQGFGAAFLMLGSITIPLAGLLFLKQQWAIARRYGHTSQSEMLNDYFGGQSIGVFSAIVATIVAVAFAGLQLHAVSHVLATLMGEMASAELIMWSIVFLTSAGLIIGGLRGAVYLSVLQTAFIAVAVAVLGGTALLASNGLEPLNQELASLAKTPAAGETGLFQIAGVIQFTAGLGAENPLGGQWTAAMVFSSVLALMGLQASPMVSQIVLSSRSPNAFAAGQTWALSAGGGALLVGFGVLIGASFLGDDALNLPKLLANNAAVSPWFSAIAALGLLAGVHLILGISVLTAAHTLIRDVYRPFFHKGLTQAHQFLLCRVAIAVLLTMSALLSQLSPTVLASLGSLALPAALQLWPALLGLSWFRFITQQAVLAGIIIGFFAVFVTDSAGIATLAFLGLDLPWGRFPWTIHSAGWGIFCNAIAVLIISAITQQRPRPARARDVRNLLNAYMRPVKESRSRGLKSAAWSAVLAWFFLAIGPGIVIGNFAFGSPSGGYEAWTVGIPSLWAWAILFWILGVLLIWFLAYGMELATPSNVPIVPLEETAKLVPRETTMQREEATRLFWVVAGLAALITATHWIFT